MIGDRALRLLVVLVFLLGVLHIAVHWAPFEDAYITYRYAENWAHGVGLRYNPGESVEGVTSLLWTAILACVTKFGLPTAVLSRFISAFCGLTIVALTMRIARRVLGSPTVSGWSVVAGLGVIAQGTWSYFSGSGMESTLFCAFVIAGLQLVLESDSHWTSAWAGIAFALAAMTRPEGLGYALLIMLDLVAMRRNRFISTSATSFTLFYLPYFIGRWLHFGYPFPNTFYAKVEPSAAVMVAGLRYTETFMLFGAFGVAAIAAMVMVVISKRDAKWVLVCCMIGAPIANSLFVGADTFLYYRLFLPAIPPGAIAVVGLCQTLYRRYVKLNVRLLAALMAGGWIVYSFASQFLPVRSFLGPRDISTWRRASDVALMNEDYFVVGRWLKEHVSPKAYLATNAAGIVPYVSGLRTLDMLGLNDEHIAHRKMALGKGVAGHEKHDTEYVLLRRPDIILLGFPILAPWQLQREDISSWLARWFFCLQGDRDLLYSEQFQRDYGPIVVNIGQQSFLLFARKQSIKGLFLAERN